MFLRLISLQLYRQRSPVWRSLQIFGKARLSKRLHKGGQMQVHFGLDLGLMRCQVLGHVEDEHTCSAFVHMCGEVCFHLRWLVCVR